MVDVSDGDSESEAEVAKEEEMPNSEKKVLMSEKYAKCPENHRLYLMTELPYMKDGKTRYPKLNCEVCKRIYEPSSVDPVSHCDKCEYDICNVCLPNSNLQE